MPVLGRSILLWDRLGGTAVLADNKCWSPHRPNTSRRLGSNRRLAGNPPRARSSFRPRKGLPRCSSRSRVAGTSDQLGSTRRLYRRRRNRFQRRSRSRRSAGCGWCRRGRLGRMPRRRPPDRPGRRRDRSVDPASRRPRTAQRSLLRTAPSRPRRRSPPQPAGSPRGSRLRDRPDTPAVRSRRGSR